MLASYGLRWWRKPKFPKKTTDFGRPLSCHIPTLCSIPGTPVFDPGPQWWQVRVLPLPPIQVPQFVWFKSLEYVRNISQWKTYLVHVDEMFCVHKMDRVKRIWYLSLMRAAKVQASLRIRAVSPEPPLLAHTSSESRGTIRQKARSLAPLNGWACAIKICNDGMLEDTHSLDGAQI